MNRPAHQILRILLLLSACVPLFFSHDAAGQSVRSGLRIGIIGAGNIGGTLAELWARAGHEIVVSSRHPEELQPMAERLGPKVRAGTPREAAAFGDVVLVSVPYGAFPQIGRDYGAELTGKIVLDPGNPFPNRDGELAYGAREQGAAMASLAYLGNVRLVRAFNTIPAFSLRSEAHRSGEKIGVPLGSDDDGALQVAIRLVHDAGFEPVVVGDLKASKRFDVGTPVFGQALGVAELKRRLGVP